MTDIQQKILELRRDYKGQPLMEDSMPSDPMKQFERWLSEAIEAGLPEPSAMTLATANETGKPSARIVLLGGYTDEGFFFHTNYRSKKGRDIECNPFAALLFYWHELFRQVNIEGKVSKLAPAESGEYFNSRPRERQIAAWASVQSSRLRGRDELLQSYERISEQYAGMPVPRPDHWGGYRVRPQAIEFWQGMPNRLHDRLKYERQDDNSWKLFRLAP